MLFCGIIDVRGIDLAVEYHRLNNLAVRGLVIQ